MRHDQKHGTPTAGSAPRGYTQRRGTTPAEVGMGQTVDLERSHVVGPRNGGERRSNAFFGSHGLFDLTTAHSELWQPSRR
ncbi:MAG: hypothetical protein KatS3mg110_2368 [Pirellulaceae bacterium]|nr:MAG: hypothetical protein KatS3mg110_2368 [Pirellulaceae bacterium]